MRYLFSLVDGIKKDLESKYIYLFLDCDGTLAPIADMPDRASIPGKTKEVLVSLSRSAKLKLAIISGRALADIKTIVGLDGIIYVGNHGLEIEGADISSGWKMAPDYKNSLMEIKARLMSEYGAMPGIFIEDKGLSLCLHYRMADVAEDEVKAVLHKMTDPYRISGKLAVMYGKKVIEIRPAIEWHKGKIVKWLLARERLLAQDENIMAVYVGDDETDEEAFKALNDNEMTIVVGNVPKSSARYYVDDTDQVYRFLAMISEMRSH